MKWVAWCNDGETVPECEIIFNETPNTQFLLLQHGQTNDFGELEWEIVNVNSSDLGFPMVRFAKEELLIGIQVIMDHSI